MDIPDIRVAANKAKRELEESGQIGHTKVQKSKPNTGNLQGNPFWFSPNESYGGLLVVRTELSETKVEHSDVGVTVRWDEIDYYFDESGKGESTWWVGNMSLAGEGDDTGEPFCIGFDFDNEAVLIVAETTGEHRIAFFRHYETIHPIDPKFLSGVCLPVVELSTEIAFEGTELTAEESAKLDKAAATGFPVVVKFCIGGIKYTSVFAAADDGAGTIFSYIMNGVAISLQKYADLWKVLIEASE